MESRPKLVGLLLCVATLVSGCIAGTSNSNKQASTGILTGTVKLASGQATVPLSSAEVVVDQWTTTTGQDGEFQLQSLSTGEHIISVYAPEDAGEAASLAQESHASTHHGMLLSSRAIDVKAGANVVPVTVSPLAELLRFGTSSWQFAFYAVPPSGLSISSGTRVIDPLGNVHDMQPHFLPQWHVWWNVHATASGDYTYDVKLSDGSSMSFSISIPASTFTDIALPALNSPADGTTVVDTTPTLTYSVTQKADRIYVRIREEGELKDNWIQVSSDDHFRLPEGKLQPGKTYVWSVQVVDHARPLPWTEAKSAEWRFTVAK